MLWWFFLNPRRYSYRNSFFCPIYFMHSWDPFLALQGSICHPDFSHTFSWPDTEKRLSGGPAEIQLISNEYVHFRSIFKTMCPSSFGQMSFGRFGWLYSTSLKCSAWQWTPRREFCPAWSLLSWISSSRVFPEGVTSSGDWRGRGRHLGSFVRRTRFS